MKFFKGICLQKVLDISLLTWIQLIEYSRIKCKNGDGAVTWKGSSYLNKKASFKLHNTTTINTNTLWNNLYHYFHAFLFGSPQLLNGIGQQSKYSHELSNYKRKFLKLAGVKKHDKSTKRMVCKSNFVQSMNVSCYQSTSPFNH